MMRIAVAAQIVISFISAELGFLNVLTVVFQVSSFLSICVYSAAVVMSFDLLCVFVCCELSFMCVWFWVCLFVQVGGFLFGVCYFFS